MNIELKLDSKELDEVVKVYVLNMFPQAAGMQITVDVHSYGGATVHITPTEIDE